MPSASVRTAAIVKTGARLNWRSAYRVSPIRFVMDVCSLTEGRVQTLAPCLRSWVSANRDGPSGRCSRVPAIAGVAPDPPPHAGPVDDVVPEHDATSRE